MRTTHKMCAELFEKELRVVTWLGFVVAGKLHRVGQIKNPILEMSVQLTLGAELNCVYMLVVTRASGDRFGDALLLHHFLVVLGLGARRAKSARKETNHTGNDAS